MQRLIKFPLYFFFIASCLGLLLRLHFVVSIENVHYPFWLHAHSHTMFLGWVLNALFIGFVTSFLSETRAMHYVSLLVLLNFFVIGMLISFPLQGYGVVSIVLSMLHTVAVVIFGFRFFKDTKDQADYSSCWFARVSLILFFISAIGPFVVGALSANGLGQSKWYYFAVYYYLHFQYNGVFTFGILALFIRLLEEKKIKIDQRKLKQVGLLLLVSVFPAYFLSTLWGKPGLLFNVIGFMAAMVQLLAFGYFILLLRDIAKSEWQRFSVKSRLLMSISFLAFGIKLVLQLLSAHPVIAKLAYEVRYFVIAYLHLVLIGMVSLFLLAWYHEKKFFPNMRWTSLILILTGFVLSESVLIVTPVLPNVFNSLLWLLGSSVLLVMGVLCLLFDSRHYKLP